MGIAMFIPYHRQYASGRASSANARAITRKTPFPLDKHETPTQVGDGLARVRDYG